MILRLAPMACAFALYACTTNAESDDGTNEPVASSNAGSLFVANKREDTLSKVDLASGEEIKRVSSCTNPHELAVSPDGQHVVLACYGGTAIAIFRTDDLGLEKVIELGANARPHGIAWHSNGSILVTAEGRGTLFAIRNPMASEPNILELGENKGPGPHMLAVDTQFHHAWGVVIPTGEVIRYDLKSGQEVARTSVGGAAEAVALSPDGTSLWVGSNLCGTVFVMDPASLDIRERISTGNFPIRIAPHPAGGTVVTSNVVEGTLSVIDVAAAEVVRTIDVADDPDQVLVTLIFSADGSRLYAAQTRSNHIAEIDYENGEVTRRFKVGDGGDGLAVLEAN